MTSPLKLTISPTSEFATVDGTTCRIWTGRMPSGESFYVFVATVALPTGSGDSDLARFLVELDGPPKGIAGSWRPPDGRSRRADVVTSSPCIGAIVRVVDAVDVGIHDVRPQIGRLGVVRRYTYDVSAAEPLIELEFGDRSRESFWPEELSEGTAQP